MYPLFPLSTILPLIFLPFTLTTTLTLLLPAELHPLPPSTHATLLTTNFTLTAPLRRSNSFSFANVPSGDYLCEVYSRDYFFSPMRVDVDAEKGIEVWRTYRGNEWGNKGERMGGIGEKKDEEVRVEVKTQGEKGYYEGRGGFSPLTLLKSPMILIAIFGMGMMVGMPYLLDSMDPETRKEFEESQKSGPLAGVTAATNPMQNFDIAAWMAGSGKSEKSVSTGADEGGGGKARRRG
ncbi:hypothetical protein MMC18_000081 [Xylographa bjoerkii]|nr:hypothetical protein [Xylographa bjoerkii]